jgi:hypothetical protein
MQDDMAATLAPPLLRTATAYATTPSIITEDSGCDFVTGQIEASCVPEFIAHVIQTVFTFTGGICFILILISGYRLLVSVVTGGDKTQGMEMLRWAVVGFVVSALTFFIIDFVISSIAGV